MLPNLQTGRAAGRVVAALGLGLTLAGCSWFRGEYDDVKCPATGVVGGLGSVSRFDGRGTGFVDLAYRATLSEVKSDCKVDSGGVTVTMTVTTTAELGPAATGRNADFVYFVAITDTHDKIVAKNLFDNPVTFKPDLNRAGGKDTLSERIPLADPKQADRYHVILGFQMTEDELAYNRSLR
jgi:hypothetical protein